MKKHLYPFLALLLLHFPQCQTLELATLQERYGSFDLIIHGGMVIDGSGAEARRADIAIAQNEIVYIGEIDTLRWQAKRVVNASGKMVSPGFIDTHSHGDPLRTPDFENFLAMGVTTITLGQDGFSPDYPQLGDWLELVKQETIHPNLVMFVGHGSLRLMSGVGFVPDPTRSQLDSLGKLLQIALDAGCFGMSTGLEYTPGMYGNAEELAYLAKIVGANGKMIMSHLRNEDDDAMDTSIDELLAQGQFCPVHVSHIKVVYGKGPDRAKEILGRLAKAREEGIPVSADVYPYTASYTGIGIVFPDWAKAPHNYQAVKQSRADELAAYLRMRVTKRNGPEATLLGTGAYQGKTLAEVAALQQKPFEQILMDDIGPEGASGAYFVMDGPLQEVFIADPGVMICSDGSPVGHHPRGHGTFAKIIETYVLEKQLIGLEEAIRKMTGLPAQTLGLTDRGRIQTGFRADLLVFDPAEVKAHATYENPFQLASGFDVVIVNGQISREGNALAQTRHGQILAPKAQ